METFFFKKGPPEKNRELNIRKLHKSLSNKNNDDDEEKKKNGPPPLLLCTHTHTHTHAGMSSKMEINRAVIRSRQKGRHSGEVREGETF